MVIGVLRQALGVIDGFLFDIRLGDTRPFWAFCIDCNGGSGSECFFLTLAKGISGKCINRKVIEYLHILSYNMI